ncbi:hypothetical protein MUK42_18992 [Musa troglodytarum]|uniref:Uncharacterized protein n=1 Tax=Musa troglodytarum TaxID=320322 RepID=A0A9E7G3M2_9LILI|nr:hypothetical protein MUK42_18992 [Musa troglodytarum]
MAAKSEAVDVEDRVHVHETVVPGPHGQQLATLSIDEDIQVHEVFKKGTVTGGASLVSLHQGNNVRAAGPAALALL